MGVVGPSTWVPLAPSAESCRLARGSVRQLLDSAAVDEETRETAMLLATELASNAIEHGGGDARLDACVRPDAVRIAVADANPALPLPRTAARAPTELDERGRGLLLVAALASRWGTDPLPHGKSVWCEIDRA
jgi:anti-sigma regulatory factor (Ser/Thr protein kinase)